MKGVLRSFKEVRTVRMVRMVRMVRIVRMGTFRLTKFESYTSASRKRVTQVNAATLRLAAPP